MNTHGSSPLIPGDRFRCPDCGVPLAFDSWACSRCGLLLRGAEAQQLWRIDNQIAVLHSRVQALYAERSVALQALRRISHTAARATPVRPEPATAAAPAVPAPSGPVVSVSPAPARSDGASPPTPAPTVELSPRSAQNLILGLGALLVGIAALVFAVWAWNDLGTGARAGVLGLTTLASAGAAFPLHRRGLRATAEAFGALTVVLLCIDAFMLWLLSDRITDGAGYTAGALTVIAVLVFLYPRLVPLRGPRPVAVVLAQPVPLLLAASSPIQAGIWMLVVAAGTVLVDVLLALRPQRFGIEVPVGTLRICALLMGVLTTLVSVLVLMVGRSSGHWNPFEWSVLPLALLLLALAGLLSARGGGTNTRPVLCVSLLLFGTAVLAASGPETPALSIGIAQNPADLTAWSPATDVFATGGREPFLLLGALYLAVVAVVTALSVGAVFLLRRDLLVPLLALVAPPALLSIPLLTGAPYVVAVVWAVLVGAALVLGSAPVRDGNRAWVPTVTGAVTLLTGLQWGTAEPRVSLATVVLIAATGLVAALLSARIAVPDKPRRGAARALYVVAVALTVVVLFAGLVHLLRLWLSGEAQALQWWMLTASVLLVGATVLALGRARSPFALGEDTESRGGLTFAGLFLLAVTPLLTGPNRSPLLSLAPASYGVWWAPPTTMLDPAHTVLGVPVPVGGAAALGTALGALAVGALAVGVVMLVDRTRLPLALVLLAPPVLLPLPVVLGAPLIVAVVWALVVGAGLLLSIGRMGLPAAITGGATFVFAMLWALPQQHTTLLVFLGTAVTVLLGAWALSSSRKAPEKVTKRLLAATVALGCITLVGSVVALIACAAMRDGHGPWWMLGAIFLLLAASAFVLGERAAAGEAPAGGDTVFGVVALAFVALVPLVVGPRGVPALAFFSRTVSPGGAEPEVLLASAPTVVGVVVEPWPEALLIAAGLLVAGASVVAMTVLLARRWTMHGVALVAPTVLTPLPVVLHAPFLVALSWALLVGAALVLCSAVRPATATTPWLPGVTGLLTLGLGVSWASVEQYTATGALLGTAVVCAFAAALARSVPVVVGATVAATAATGGAVFLFPLALGMPTEYAAFAVIALTAGVAAVAPRLRSPLLEAAEIPAAVWALIALLTIVGVGARAGLTALALALLGVIALACAARPGRRFLAVAGGLLMLGALWVALAAWEVNVVEAYTMPPAVAALVIGWEWTRRSVEGEAPSSWLAHGGGLLLLLLPSIVQILNGQDLAWRVPVVLVLGLGVALWGLRARLQAALVLGGVALVATSLRAFGPPLWGLLELLPNWVPFAVVGGVLLAVGARYEANLERVRRLGRMVFSMR